MDMSELCDSEGILEISKIGLVECLDRTQRLLASVQTAAADYYNSTPLIELNEEFEHNGQRLSWPVHIDLKALGVIAALAQAPVILRGSTDSIDCECGKEERKRGAHEEADEDVDLADVQI